MSEKNLMLCVIVFAVLFLAWSAILISAAAQTPENKKKRWFDERQLLAQGTAYKTAFWAMLVYYCIQAIITGVAEIVWCDQLLSAFLGVFVGVGSFAVICIIKDAFARLNQSRTGLIVLWNIIGLSQLSLGITHIKDHSLIENGVLSAGCIQFAAMLLVLVIDAAYIVKRCRDKREEQE